MAFKINDWPGSLYLKVDRNWAIHKTFFPAFVVAIYSALVKEKPTIAYCFNKYNTGLPENKKAYLPIDCCPSLSSA